jgi:hypothetical protein
MGRYHAGESVIHTHPIDAPRLLPPCESLDAEYFLDNGTVWKYKQTTYVSSAGFFGTQSLWSLVRWRFSPTSVLAFPGSTRIGSFGIPFPRYLLMVM